MHLDARAPAHSHERPCSLVFKKGSQCPQPSSRPWPSPSPPRPRKAQTCLRRPEPRGARSPQMPPNVKDSHADCLDEATATCAAYYAGPPIAPDPDLEEQTTATPPAQDAPAAPNPKANPPQLGPTLSCLDMDNYRIERDARGRILIHQCDYDVLMAHAYRGLPSTRFMMDNESFTVVPGPYPFGTPPTVPPPTREPAPAQSTPDEPAPAQQAPTPTDGGPQRRSRH